MGSAQHLGEALRPGQLRRRSQSRTARLRRDRRSGQGVPAAGPRRGVLGLPPEPQFRDPGRDRPRRRGYPHGRHGPLRWAGGREECWSGPRSGAPCRCRDLTTHKSLRGPRGGLVLAPTEYATLRRQRLPDGPRRPAAPRDGGQGRCSGRGSPALVRDLRDQIVDNAAALADGLLGRGARSSPVELTTTSSCWTWPPASV